MIYVVGIGPGDEKHLTPAAREAISGAQWIVGYKTYIDLIRPIISGKNIYENGMRGEVERIQKAVEISRTGHDVAIVSSGDAGVYGMAGLVYELTDDTDIVQVIPGVTASSMTAAVLGAPLMHDYCHISLSDLLTPYDLIMKRVEYAAASDFVICLYNPKSHGRPNHLKAAIDSIIKLKGEELWVGIVKNAGRQGQWRHICQVKDIPYDEVDMMSTVIIGNRSTTRKDNYLVTPRGYRI